LPYAEAAAEDYAGWGLSCAAECHEALQQWDKAEHYYRACSERYDGSGFLWYFFCRRTEEADLEEARRLALAIAERLSALKDRPVSFDLVTFYLLEGQPEKALAEMEKVPSKNPDVNDVIWLAMIADETEDVKKRDAALNRARMLAAAKGDGLTHAPNGVSYLVNLLANDLAQGGKGQIDAAAADKFAAQLTALDRFYLQWALAQYLDQHGQSKAADHFGKQCMGFPRIEARGRTLAGAALLAHGIKPSDYRALLQPDAAETEKPKPHASQADAAETAKPTAETPKTPPPSTPKPSTNEAPAKPK
jgi:hypothetical protein